MKGDYWAVEGGQRIQTVDDAAVDHIVHYWCGGKTVPSNARLAHRYCNGRRGGGDGPQVGEKTQLN